MKAFHWGSLIPEGSVSRMFCRNPGRLAVVQLREGMLSKLSCSLLLFGLLTVCGKSFADDTVCELGPTSEDSIRFLKQHSSGIYIVATESGLQHSICDVANDGPACSSFVSTLLVAHVAGRKASLRYAESKSYECDVNWGGGTPGQHAVDWVYLY